MLDEVSEQIELIVARETKRLLDDKGPMDDKKARVLELLSKIVDHSIARRKGRKPVDPFASVATEDLEKEFD
jgi:hypothetical protein